MKVPENGKWYEEDVWMSGGGIGRLFGGGGGGGMWNPERGGWGRGENKQEREEYGIVKGAWGAEGWETWEGV
jgi:hypothetical protein